MKFRVLAVVLATLTLPALAHAQAAKPPAKEADKPAAAAAKEGPLAIVNGVAIPRRRAEFLVHQQVARGAKDTDAMRAQIREVLINNEIIMQEANRSGIAKRPDVQTQLELARQEVIVNSYLSDYINRNQVTEAEIQQQYELAKQQTGTTEYKVHHILVKTEDEAKRAIEEIRKGGTFEDVARRHSIDSTKEKGGDLGWSVLGNMDKTFADALAKLEKGKMTDAPVRTRFGYHVIQLDDLRPVKFPTLFEVKPQLQQRLSQIKIERMIGEMRAKAKVE